VGSGELIDSIIARAERCYTASLVSAWHPRTGICTKQINVTASQPRQQTRTDASPSKKKLHVGAKLPPP